MSRLIDADALADALFEQRKNYPLWVADVIGKMPDAIIRCKNCKYYDAEAEWLKCKAHHAPDSPEWFCADGERG